MAELKRRIAALLAVVIATAALPACHKLDENGSQEEQNVHFTAEDIGTKVMLDSPVGTTYPTLWCNGDKVAVSMNYGDPQTVTASTTDGGETAEFEAPFTADGSAGYRFFALSPASAGQYLAKGAHIWNLIIPEDQTPATGTPDPEAMVIAAVSDSYGSMPGNVSFAFTHVTAYGCLSFLNLDLGDAKMQAVTIDSPVNLVGDFDYYLEDNGSSQAGTIEDSEGSGKLTLYTDATEDIWFACAPADLSGRTLTVSIVTDRGTLVKYITFPDGRGFTAGKITRMAIDMDGIVIPEADVTTGAASKVTQNSATLNASFANARGTIYEAYFRYGTSPSNLGKMAYYNDGGLVGASGSFSVDISSLEPGTTYYYQAWMQLGEEDFHGEIKSFTTEEASSGAYAGYLELPASEETSANGIYSMTFGSGTDRNYSFYYDTSVYAALWVAYPLTSSHLSGSGGSKSWEYNPYVPEQYQINVKSRSYGSNYGNSTYSRGHQIPNADRKSDADMNNQTYYLTNQTPQIQNGFNGTVWSDLEDNVRSVASATDTLYVVTGAAFYTNGGHETISYLTAAKSGITPTTIPVPNYYYKVLMKVKRSGGNVIGASAIGVWMPHTTYSSSSAWRSCVVSVDEIEELTGFDFFVNLPDNLESGAEAVTSWSTFSSY